MQEDRPNIKDELISSRSNTSAAVNRRMCQQFCSRKQIFIFIVILSMMLQTEARSNGMMHIQSTSTINYGPRDNNDIENEQENLHEGHSGDPWGSSLIRNNENVYIHLPLYVNTTVNDTKSNQLSTTPRTEFLGHRRFKRGVIHLYNMVVCATGCNPLAYKGYGCYCGFLGSGYVIDGIDRCCKMHDWCYDATDCPMFMEYFVPYYWRCYHGYKPVCAVEHGDWGGAGSCAQRLCECDRSLAECLRRYPCPTTKAVCTSSPWRLVQNLFMIM